MVATIKGVVLVNIIFVIVPGKIYRVDALTYFKIEMGRYIDISLYCDTLRQ